MIKKNFELEKLNYSNHKMFLFYGENIGLKNELINSKLLNFSDFKAIKTNENEIFDNFEEFVLNIVNKSLFENGKIYIVDETTEKSLKLIENISEKNLENIILIFKSGKLEKKSKLRIFFEKSKKFICSAFYPDDNKTLYRLAFNFLKEKKISISPESINLLVERSREDRNYLNIELKKIEMYSYNKKNITIDEIYKLTNLSENYEVFELVDNCLSKNTRKTINILNENNYSSEDCILIIRTLLSKTKRLLKLKENQEKTKNLDEIITTFRPPIFWKEKEIVKKQIQTWTKKEVYEIIYEINETELMIKRNIINSLNILSDFIIKISKPINN